jgi:SAM-dependent methyltransferase
MKAESLVQASPDGSGCFLCGRLQIRVVEQLSGNQIRALWKELGHEFTREAWGKIHGDYLVTMRQCLACGFTFFDPSLAGNEVFYRELEHPEYFTRARLEFERTLQFARRRELKRVLDVGCGSGYFLDQAKQAGLETYGLELNSQAAQKASAKGHTILPGLLHEINRAQLSGELDLITLFQVLEHVPDPLALMKQAAALLDSGKYIAVAVPSIRGPGRFLPWDPAQWPPHHLSWWRLADFEQLAVAAGLRLVKSGGDMLFGSGFETSWRLHNQLASVLGKPGSRCGLRLVRLVSLLYRKAGLKYLFPRWGTSIYSYFQKV